MVLTDIDKDFVEIINNLNRNGFRPFSSCDGVDKNHIEAGKEIPGDAYINFLNSDNILNLMAVMLRDKDNFSIDVDNLSHVEPYMYFENKIDGISNGVRFSNHNGELTDYFSKIVNGVINKEIVPREEEKKLLMELDSVLEDENTNLHFVVYLNTWNNNKDKRINSMYIETKFGLGYDYDLDELTNEISEKLGIDITSPYELEGRDEYIDKDRNILTYIYLNNEHASKIPDLIRYCKEREKDLKRIERVHSDISEEEMYEEYERYEASLKEQFEEYDDYEYDSEEYRLDKNDVPDDIGI